MQPRGRNRLWLAAALACALVCWAQVALGQRGGNSAGDDDDFDDAGFDDSGYAQPTRETDSSNHNPNSYSPSEGEELDDDDDVDESHVSPQVAEGESAEPGESGAQESEGSPVGPTSPDHYQQLEPHAHMRRHHHEELLQQRRQQAPYLDHVQTQENFYAPPGSMLVANVGPHTGYGFGYAPHMRYRRSARDEAQVQRPENDIEDEAEPEQQQRRLVRRKRYAKGYHHKKHSYIGPVYTYVKTDKHANFKWGVKHKVGKQHG